jgi:hypothetical protein
MEGKVKESENKGSEKKEKKRKRSSFKLTGSTRSGCGNTCSRDVSLLLLLLRLLKAIETHQRTPTKQRHSSRTNEARKKKMKKELGYSTQQQQLLFDIFSSFELGATGVNDPTETKKGK